MLNKILGVIVTVGLPTLFTVGHVGLGLEWLKTFVKPRSND